MRYCSERAIGASRFFRGLLSLPQGRERIGGVDGIRTHDLPGPAGTRSTGFRCTDDPFVALWIARGAQPRLVLDRSQNGAGSKVRDFLAPSSNLPDDTKISSPDARFGRRSSGRWTCSPKCKRRRASEKLLVEPMGFEPTTSSMPSRRASNCATAPPPSLASFIAPWARSVKPGLAHCFWAHIARQ